MSLLCEINRTFSFFPCFLGGGVDESLNLVGRGCAGLLFVLFGFWGSDLILQLQLCPVSPWSRQAAEQQFFLFPQFVFSHANKNSSSSNNCELDAVLISIINGCTSVYSATVIYSIIGFRAVENYDGCMAEWVPECKDHLRCNDRQHLAHLAVLLFHSNILKVTNYFNYPEGSVTQGNYEDVLSNINMTTPAALPQLALTTCDLETFLSQVSLECVAKSVV